MAVFLCGMDLIDVLKIVGWSLMTSQQHLTGHDSARSSRKGELARLSINVCARL
jgi:hypothetical protein